MSAEETTLVFSYKTLRVQVIDEMPSYSWWDFFSELGGMFALLLGTGVYTMIEGKLAGPPPKEKKKKKAGGG